MLLSRQTKRNKKNTAIRQITAVLLSAAFFLSQSMTAAATEEQPETAVSSGSGTVVSLEISGASAFTVREKPSYDWVLNKLPQELSATLADGSVCMLPVTWEASEDYEETDSYYYVFDPVLPEGYSAPQLSELPYVILWIDPLAAEDSADTPDADGVVRFSAMYGVEENEEEIYHFLRDHMELNTAGAAGVLANIRAESNFDPNAVGDNNTSYGICQWHNSRWTRLKEYCSDHDLDPETLTGQLYYLQDELERYYPGVLNTLKNVPDTADGAYDAGYQFCLKFEVPANKEQKSDSRGKVARDTYWPKYHDGQSESGDHELTQEEFELLKAFVTRLYLVTLGREPDERGLYTWMLDLAEKRKTGAEVALGFYTSPEMQNKNLTNAQFVTLAYRGMMGREPDAGGLADWVSAMQNGVSVIYVIDGFSGSQEFQSLCESARITPGRLTEQLENRDRNYGVTRFVSRLYTTALGRDYDVDGLNNWCGQILLRPSRATMLEVATNGFFHSQEFLNKNLNNGAFLNVLYRTFLDRGADAQGYNSWLTILNQGSQTRDEVIAGFANSQEFSLIMAATGIY